MPIEQIDPEEAQRRMGEGYIYVDVRSTMEFSRGHATGACNIPLLETDRGGGMVPNEDFLAVCKATLPPDAKLVVGCAVGGRSQRACEILGDAGYGVVANIQGGFSGARDQMGTVIAPGWADLGLSVSKEEVPGATYRALLEKARG